MAEVTYNIHKYMKISIALAVIYDNGFGSRPGLSKNELLVLDADNTIKAIIPVHTDIATGWELVGRADLVREFSKIGVILS